MAEKKKYNSILISGRKDETLTYSRYIKDEESGESVKETLDKKVNVSDELETQQIKDGAITNEKLAADSVGNGNIQDGSVSNEKLEEGSVTNEKLAVNSITKDKLQDKTIGVEKLDNELRQTIAAATGLPEDLVETIQNVDNTLKDHQRQLDDKQSQIDDKQQQITANDDDISLLQTRSTQMEETIKGIAATGGASQATAVTYDNEKSKLTAINIQSAVDEVVDKIAIKDEEGTVVETPFRYIQNEEFIFAKVDSEDKLLFGIQWDGTPVFGKTSAVEDELQKQITLLAERVAAIVGDEDITSTIDTLNELKTFFANIENTQSLTDILSNLDNVAKNLDKTTIKDEEGYVQDTPFRVISNEEFIFAVVDSEDRILFAIYRATGKQYNPQNDMYHISQSEEFLWVILDAVNHPLLGIKRDGTSWAAKAQWLDDIKAIKKALSSIDETLKIFQPKEDGKGLINIGVADSFFYISNDEYIIALVDAENRILAGIKYDGEPYFPNHEMYSVITNEEWLYAIIDAEGKVLGGFRANDGHMFVGSIDISTFFSDAIIDIADIKKRTAHLSTIVNDEYLSVETDAEGKVIGYIAPDGSHYLYKVKSETIPEEFSHIDDPEGRTEITTDAEGKLLGYRDSEGQRHESSMSIEKKLSLTKESAKSLLNTMKENGEELRIGKDWSNESLVILPIPEIASIVNITSPDMHFSEYKTSDKKCTLEYLDKYGNYFRKEVLLNAQGSSSMGYEVKNQAIDFTDGSEIKFGNWVAQDSFHLKKYYIDSFRGQCIVAYHLMEEVYQTRLYSERRPWSYTLNGATDKEGTSDMKSDFENGALGHPDGFPIVVYLNGVYQGLYTWNLKKHRDNYFCNKKKSSNIILDGILSDDYFWKGNIDWTQFEIRNPKGLKDINGNDYNGDIPLELSDTDKLSKQVKSFVQHLASAKNNLKSNKTKEEFEKYFNVPMFIDYWIVSQYIYNFDGFAKNWIWCTWDGYHWCPTLYDTDSIWGMNFQGTGVYSRGLTEICSGGCTSILYELYKEEIEARYKELRSKDILSVNNIVHLLTEWLGQIGYENLKDDLSLLPETPSYRKSNINEGWEIYELWAYPTVTPYSDSSTYNTGDKVTFLNTTFVATKNDLSGIKPVDETSLYKLYPYVGGMFNSVLRVEKWQTEREKMLDKYLNYNK